MQFIAYTSLKSKTRCFRQHSCGVACIYGMQCQVYGLGIQNQGCSEVGWFKMDVHCQRPGDHCKFDFELIFDFEYLELLHCCQLFKNSIHSVTQPQSGLQPTVKEAHT